MIFSEELIVRREREILYLGVYICNLCMLNPLKVQNYFTVEYGKWIVNKSFFILFYKFVT